MITKRITNETKGTVLADRARVANTTLKRLKGLLGREALKDGEGLIIIPCSSIHTFFMRFSIDVVFLDRSNRVVAMARSLSPARLFSSMFKGNLVIELPVGTLTKTNTEISDQIVLKTVENIE